MNRAANSACATKPNAASRSQCHERGSMGVTAAVYRAAMSSRVPQSARDPRRKCRGRSLSRRDSSPSSRLGMTPVTRLRGRTSAFSSRVPTSRPRSWVSWGRTPSSARRGDKPRSARPGGRRRPPPRFFSRFRFSSRVFPPLNDARQASSRTLYLSILFPIHRTARQSASPRKARFIAPYFDTPNFRAR